MLQRFQQMFPIMLFLGCDVTMAKELCHKAVIINSNYTTNKIGFPRIKAIPNLTLDELTTYRDEIQDCLRWTIRRISEVELSICTAMEKFPDTPDDETEEQRDFRIALEGFMRRSIENLNLDPGHLFNRRASSKKGYIWQETNNGKPRLQQTHWAPYDRNVHCWRHAPFKHGGQGVRWIDRTDKWRPVESLRYGNIRTDERTIF
ncbi:hypothetical protein FPQ18DRAFT_139697 [Pyronema domesticum]|nr:hypothetical protein FPQ18DRAFT_139697 [Pyronema domesticum]